MCRLLLASKKAIMTYDRAHCLAALFAHLEHQCGGHGNGLALVKDGTIVFHKKGTDYTVEQAAKACTETRYDFAVFHTRVASVSSVNDANCHPFTFQKTDAMAMNGTISGISGVAKALGITDTEMVFNAVKGAGMDTTLAALSSLSPVFVGCSGGRPYAVKNDGDLVEWSHHKLRDKDFFFTSSLPVGTPGLIHLPDGFTWADGQDLTPPSKVYSIPTSRYWIWDDDDLLKDTPSSSSTSILTDYDEGYTDGWAEGYAEGYRHCASGLPMEI